MLLDNIRCPIEVHFLQGIDKVSVSQIALLPSLQHLRPIAPFDWVRPEIVDVVHFHETEVGGYSCPVLICAEDLCHLQEGI